MAKHIPANEPASFKVKLRGIKEGTETAKFQIYTVGNDPCEVLDDVEGPITGNTATCEWTAKGPPEDGKKREWRVQYKVTVPSKKEGVDIEKVSEELVVYNAWLDITSVRAEDDSVLPDAPYEIRIGRNKPIKGNTGQSGTFKETALPPGKIKSFKWLKWAKLETWEEEDGVKRKAKLKVCKVATIVSPEVKRKSGKRVMKQWTNLAVDAAKPEQGPKLKIKVKLEEGRAGDKVWLKTEFDDETKRNDVTRVVEGGACEDWCPDGGKVETLAADDGEAEFSLDLGWEGGSKVVVKVGGSENCEDDTLIVTNWRKLYYQVTCPSDMKPPKMKRMRSALARVFIDYEHYKTLKIKPSNTQDAPANSWYPGSDLGGKTKAKFLNVGDANKGYWHGKFEDDKTPLGVHVVCCHTQFDADAADCEQSVVVGAPGFGATELTDTYKGKIKFKGKRVWGMDWSPPSDYFVLKTCLKDGGSALRASTWSEVGGGGASGSFAEDDVEYKGGDIMIRFPAAAVEVLEADPPGKISIDFNIFAAKGPYLGEADGTDGYKQLIACRAGNKGTRSHISMINDVMAHELGHTVNQTANVPPPGLAQGDHGRRYTANGHQGAHCAAGMEDGVYSGGAGSGDQAGDFTGVGVCKCLMYGENSPKKSNSNGKFCPRCVKFLRAEKMDTLH